jgi:hypothetical protein
MVERSMSTQLTFAAFSDTALIDEVARLAGAERRATARLIAALAEFDARRLYLAQGCSSLFVYCTRVLHLSEHAAYGRIEAARAGRRIPTVLEMLERGALTLTSIGLLAPHLTLDNHLDVLSRAKHRTRREVEEIVASLCPKPDSPAMVRRLPAARPQATKAVRQDDGVKTVVPNSNVAVHAAPLAASAPPSVSRPIVTPVAPERYRIQFTADRETLELLDRAKALMRHISPGGDLAVVFRRALQSLIEDLERKRLAVTSNVRRLASPVGRGRRIPAAVRREVWKRDAGRCAFVGALGRCEETGFLEFHHVQPFAAGGESTTLNIELRCRAHNQYEAGQFFGPLIARERRAPFGPHSVQTECESAANRSAVLWSGTECDRLRPSCRLTPVILPGMSPRDAPSWSSLAWPCGTFGAVLERAPAGRNRLADLRDATGSGRLVYLRSEQQIDARVDAMLNEIRRLPTGGFESW